jgi:hypothetical protein
MHILFHHLLHHAMNISYLLLLLHFLSVTRSRVLDPRELATVAAAVGMCENFFFKQCVRAFSYM